jgi:hypothetical protein
MTPADIVATAQRSERLGHGGGVHSHGALSGAWPAAVNNVSKQQVVGGK